MSKIITSPIKRWPGTATIADPLSFPQAEAIQDVLGLPDEEKPVLPKKRVWLTVNDKKKLPAVLACVEKWDLENFNPDPFPASPRHDSHKLVDWIWSEIYKVYIGEFDDPNA